MDTPEQRLAALGFVLPAPAQLPAGVTLPFALVRVVGSRALVAGHGPTNADGSMAAPFGKVGATLTLEQGVTAARLTTLAMLASLKRELGELSRIRCWVRIFGMVNSAPGFHLQPVVMNGCSELLRAVFGDEAGTHARCAIGVAELPFNLPVEIEGEVELWS